MPPNGFVSSLVRLTIFILFVGLSNPRLVFAQPDDAKVAGKSTADFPELSTDAFKQMDGEVPLSSDETKGRNTWILWTASGQVLLDRMARATRFARMAVTSVANDRHSNEQ